MKDLWPQFGDLSKQIVTTPLSIAIEQATLLGNKTGNTIVGEVRKNHLKETPFDFEYRFVISAPTIQYGFLLFKMAYDITLYPVHVFPDSLVLKEIKFSSVQPTGAIIAENEGQFQLILQTMFAAPKTLKVISAIAAQIPR